ncbi:esterase family protein [Streptomyces parvulus]|uniref:Alpha/beta hydrolase family protein n=1 Tax=Streptomyces parvulus TaxID=146923 RepID=A0ABV5DI84_9ACTN|nr:MULTISPECIES: alpha/beta hydrolase family protein [Streptomyces]MCC9155055.1 esterase family protein [Streptomyces parvulus]MCE7691805.1 esterase family protein [Streptomyces parvulus]WML84731.1 alpha/beta hydrolase family protein [Streptomyces sp. VNUA74]
MSTAPTHPRTRAFLAPALLLIVLLATLAPTAPARASGSPAPFPSGAEVVAVTRVADRQVDLSVRSTALGGRTVKVRLLTPDGWDPSDRHHRRHWPTLWLLHGCCGDYTSWTAMTDVARTDSLRDVLVVMPEAGWNGWYSDWWNHGEGGDPAWETFHTVELRRLLERDWGAGDNRVVAGLSMGGQGALSYAARHPGMFRAAAAYSGSAHPLLNDESTNRILGFFAGQGDDPLRVWGDPVAQRRIWQSHDPFHLARRLKSIPVYLSCGDGTTGPLDAPGSTSALEADFNRQNQALAAELKRVGARHVTTNFYGPGTHGWAYWERELHASLPMLLKALRVSG